MIDLKPFCEGRDGSRYYLQAPFNQGEYTYATDGHILVQVAKRDGMGTDGPEVAKVTAGPFARIPTANWTSLGAAMTGETFTWPGARPEQCEICKGQGFVRECSECHGTGESECFHCGHEGDCGGCVGRGVNPTTKGVGEAEPCKKCEGRGAEKEEPPTLAKRLGAQWFNSELLDRITALPGLMVDPPPATPAGVYGEPLLFKFNEGYGVLMAMREPSEEERAAALASVVDAALTTGEAAIETR